MTLDILEILAGALPLAPFFMGQFVGGVATAGTPPLGFSNDSTIRDDYNDTPATTNTSPKSFNAGCAFVPVAFANDLTPREFYITNPTLSTVQPAGPSQINTFCVRTGSDSPVSVIRSGAFAIQYVEANGTVVNIPTTALPITNQKEICFRTNAAIIQSAANQSVEFTYYVSLSVTLLGGEQVNNYQFAVVMPSPFGV